MCRARWCCAIRSSRAGRYFTRRPSLLVGVAEGSNKVATNGGDRLHGVDGGNQAAGTVVVQHGVGLTTESLEAGADDVDVVIATLHERLAGDIVDASHLRRVELGVVAAATGLVDPTPADALLHNLVVDLELHDLVQLGTLLLQHLVQHLGLSHGAGEAIQHEAVAAVGLVDRLAHQAHNNFVVHHLAGVHLSLGTLAQLRASSNGGAQHVTGGQVAHAVLLLDERRLGALAAARRADKDGTCLLLLIAVHTVRQLLEQLIGRET
mmetsp:Transcript_4825/g.10299  ORF Transcript_4825/g.10299 Transcript_4825/m.10299 type:complete len:265 (+) Transcript_4825:131-925(+)